MSLIRTFRKYISSFFVPAPSENWKEVENIELVFDHFKATLNFIALGDSIHKLVVFGKPTNKRPHGTEIYEWKHLGLRIGTYDEQIVSFEAVFKDWMKKWEQYNPAKIKILKGKVIELSETTSRQEIENFFGQPNDQIVINEDLSLSTYHDPRFVINFDFDPSEKLQLMSIE